MKNRKFEKKFLEKNDSTELFGELVNIGWAAVVTLESMAKSLDSLSKFAEKFYELERQKML